MTGRVSTRDPESSCGGAGLGPMQVTRRAIDAGTRLQEGSQHMISEQALIGSTTAALCAIGLWRQDWLLEETRKGRRLVRWCGAAAAPWVLRIGLALGLGFGVLLAAGVVNPIRWSAPPSSTHGAGGH